MSNERYNPVGLLQYRGIEERRENEIRSKVDIRVYGQTELDERMIWNDAPVIIRAVANAKQKYLYYG